MRDSYVEREVPTSVEEHYDNMNEADILEFTDDDIKFQVHNIEEMVCNVKRHGDDDQYNNGEHAKYKKMIEDFKKPFYHGCVAQYMRLYAMVKLFQLKASNRWSDYSFKDLLMLLKDMLPQGNAVPETVYEVSHPVFKAKTRCSSYVCPGSNCHTYGQNVSTEYQCLYYIVSYYKNLLQVQKQLNSRMDPILPQAVDRGFHTPRKNLHQRTPHLLSSRI
jgi:hypothetical protein